METAGKSRRRHAACWLPLVLFLGLSASPEQEPASQRPEILPTGMMITPTAAQGSIFQPLNPDLPDLPQFTVDHPVSTAVSPDGSTLLILTSGFNRNHGPNGREIPAQSGEHVFVYDISQQPPVKKQVLHIPNSFAGLAWNPDGKHFYVSGGSNDNVHIFALADGHWSEVPEPIALGHHSGLGVKVSPDDENKPVVAGLAVDSSGTHLLAVNYENDSVSLLDLKSAKKTAELDLRPGRTDPSKKGIAGGEYPFWAVFKGDDKAYVSSLRDRELVVLDLHSAPKIVHRIKIHGQPNKLILNRAQTLLFAAVDNSDSVNVISTATDQVVAAIKTLAPHTLLPNQGRYKGSNPNSLALSPDEHTLYVTNGGTNSVAVINLAKDKDLDDSQTVGLIPTGWYPSSVSLNRDGSVLYVINGKGNAGPNPKGCRSASAESNCGAANQYILQSVKGGFLTFPRPSAAHLRELTGVVARNNHFSTTESIARAEPVFSFLRTKIKHVLYIVKENRTYDQVLGDLEKGNGDPSLTLFKEAVTPNHHQLARQFVTLDNFFDSGEVSGNGWNWTTAGRATDNVEKTIAINYARRAFNYDYQGYNRNINVGATTPELRKSLNPAMSGVADAEDQLPGPADVAAPDGPEDESGAGYLWDSALRAGLSVRNYGFYCDLNWYSERKSSYPSVPLLRDPASSGTRVAFPANPRLQELTDPYFRSFDQSFPDYWRYKEWEREFREFEKNHNLPSLELLWINHDHFGSFGSAIDGVNTVEREIADNDYAVGMIVQRVAHSQYSQDTLIFVIEDDAQNGPDHVDAHRSIAFVVGPFVKQGALVSQRYNTVSMLRTIEEVLGIKPLGLNDALQGPMSEVFTSQFAPWTYEARVPVALRSTQLPLPHEASARGPRSWDYPMHDAQYWDKATRGLDFTGPDGVDAERLNLILWNGIMGQEHPYPYQRSGQDLSKDRKRLLQNFLP
jgi:DNA-binding beta-propeller fold protein YncE